MVSVGTTLLCPFSQKGATDIMLMNMHGCVLGVKMYKTGGMVDQIIRKQKRNLRQLLKVLPSFSLKVFGDLGSKQRYDSIGCLSELTAG